MAILRAIQGLNPGQVFPLEGTSVILGRHPNCDIVLESAAVSRQHARILNADGDFYLEDLHSRNGTFLNGRQIAHRERLDENDEVGICDLAFIFHQGPPELNLTPLPIERRTRIADAMLVDEEEGPGADNSRVTSRLNVAAHSGSLRIEANTEAKLKALLEISRNLGKALELSDVLPRLLDSLFKIFPQADRGFIVLRDLHSGRLAPRAVKHRRHEDTQTIRISRTIVDNVMASKEAILSADAAEDSRFDMSQSIVDFQIRSMMCAPLVNRDGEALGIIQIDTVDPKNRFCQDDLDVLVSVACQAAFAVENARLYESAVRDRALQRELAVAHEVQRGFLPAAAPQLPGYVFFDFYEPASQLGGDYYDYVALPDGRLAVVVADVSGKGISASLLMAKLSAETRYCLAREADPAAALARLNRAFCDSSWEDRFITMAIAILDPQHHEVLLVNAGHPLPLLRRGPDRVEPVGEAETRLPLGVADDEEYAVCRLTLAPGDALLLYTDGISEAMNANDELYGTARLLPQLHIAVDNLHLLGRRVINDVKRFVGVRPQSDDLCLVCFERERPETAPPAAS